MAAAEKKSSIMVNTFGKKDTVKISNVKEVDMGSSIHTYFKDESDGTMKRIIKLKKKGSAE